MANKAISELPEALNVNNQDLFVLEQGGLAKKLPAETFITEQGIIDALAEALDGHGGIQSVTLSSVSGRIRTYLITFADQSATTFQVLDGTSISSIQKTSTAGLVDTYTVFMTDGTTSFFQVRNGQDGSATWDQINSKAPVIINSATGATASFPDGADNMPLKNFVVDIEPVQSGSGDPSSSNIRPITGWDSVTVNRTGTNLVNQDVLLLGTSWTYSQEIPTYKGAPVYTGTLANLCGNGKPLASEIPVTFKYEANTRYRVRLWWRRVTPSTSNGIRIYAMYTDGTTSSSGNQSNNTENFIRQGLLTEANKTVSKFYFSYNSSSGVYISGLCIEKYDGTQVEGDTAVVGNELQTIPIDWTSVAGTVYGGSLDVTTGVLTVDRAVVTLDGTQYTMGGRAAYTNVARYWINQPIALKSKGQSSFVLADKATSSYSCTIGVSNSTPEGYYIWVYGNDTVYITLPLSIAASNAEATQWLKDNPIQLCYELATPQTYQLTPQEVKTLLGTNNVWADTGNVTVEYRADTELYLEKDQLRQDENLTYVETSSTASRAYTVGDYVTINGILCKITATVASGGTLASGTNYIAVGSGGLANDLPSFSYNSATQTLSITT